MRLDGVYHAAERSRAEKLGRAPTKHGQAAKKKPAWRRVSLLHKDVQALFEYAAFMEETLDMAVDLTRGLNLVAAGLDANDDRKSGQPVLVLGRLIAGQLAAVKSALVTLLKASRECGA